MVYSLNSTELLYEYEQDLIAFSKFGNEPNCLWNPEDGLQNQNMSSTNNWRSILRNISLCPPLIQFSHNWKK